MAIKPKNDETGVLICLVIMVAFIGTCIGALIYLGAELVKIITR